MLALAFAGNQDGHIMRADGKGYYGYLPAIFIYQDPEYKFIDSYEAKYYPKEMYADFTSTLPDGQRVNKYFIGVAILQLPFFLIAHLLSILFGLPADGYAPLYQFTFMVAGIMYVYLGFRALMEVLKYYGGTIWQHYAAIALLLAGTNLWHYSLFEQCMSHVYSLTVSIFFFLALLRIFRSQSRKWILVAGLCLGMIIAIRPINLLILGAIPLAAGNWRTLKEGFAFMFREYRTLLLGAIVCAMPSMLQMLAWYWQTGSPVVYSYAQEGFNFAEPQIFNILFSYRKGWFLWSPMVAVGLLGYILWLRRESFQAASIMVFLFLTIYVLSCWWTWSYGMSFGSRPFIEYLFFLPAGLVLLWQRSNRRVWRIPVAVVCCFLVFVNIVQAYQYRKFILLWDGMDRDSYWQVFLKTGPKYQGMLWRTMVPGDTTLATGVESYSEFNNYEAGDRWDPAAPLSDSAFSAKKAGLLNPQKEFSGPFVLKITDEILKSDSVLEATVWFNDHQQSDGSTLAVTVTRDEKNVVWNDRLLSSFSLKKPGWHRAVLKYALEKEKLKQGDELRVFVWNQDKMEDLVIDDFRVRLIRVEGNSAVSEEVRRK